MTTERVTDSSLIGSWMETVRLGKTERAKLRPGPRREREGEGESALSIGRGPNNNMAAKEKKRHSPGIGHRKGRERGVVARGCCMGPLTRAADQQKKGRGRGDSATTTQRATRRNSQLP